MFALELSISGIQGAALHHLFVLLFTVGDDVLFGEIVGASAGGDEDESSVAFAGVC
jgi:hypothetical protein